MKERWTIVICTYNRAESLEGMLCSLEESMRGASCSAPILVVDNASTDGTPAVVREWARRLPLRGVTEEHQGLSAARNRAVEETGRGSVWFLDDDVVVTPGWFSAAARGVESFPQADFLGGRVLPRWDRPAPRWMRAGADCQYKGMLVWYDQGEAERDLAADMPAFFGANIMFRRRVFDAGRRFDTQLGRIGNRARLGEEAQLQNALRGDGRTGRYLPEAAVWHPVPQERIRLGYLCRWHVESGRASVRMAAESDVPNKWHGVPRYVYRQTLANLVSGACGTAMGTLTLNPARAVRGLAEGSVALGKTAEILGIGSTSAKAQTCGPADPREDTRLYAAIEEA